MGGVLGIIKFKAAASDITHITHVTFCFQPSNLIKLCFQITKLTLLNVPQFFFLKF